MVAPRRTRLVTPCLFALLVFAASAADAGRPHGRVVVFGDSLSDPGNAFVLLGFAEGPPFPGLIPDASYARGGASRAAHAILADEALAALSEP